MNRSIALLGLAALVAVNTNPLPLRKHGPRVNRATFSDSLPSPAAPGSAEPSLVAGADGRVYMSWLEPADSGHALRFAVLQGRTWSRPRTIRAGRDFFVNWADFPSLEVLPGNRLAAHWLQRNGRGTYAYGVRLALSADGGETWSAPLTPHRDTTQTEHGFVALWAEGDQLGAVWLDGRKFSQQGHSAANEMMLMTTTVGRDGKLAPEVQLDARTCDCCQNAAAITTNGPVITYRNRSNDEIRDIYITRRVGGKWTEGAPVYADNWHINACPVNGPAVAAAGNRVAVAWFTAANDSPRVKLAFSNDGGARFAAPVRVDGGNPAGRVDVVMLPDGSALVIWLERTGGEVAAVRGRKISRDGRAGAPVTIATSSAARASGFPRLALTASDVVFAWTVPGQPSQIRVARAAVAEFR
jgi:hypothetical protein